MAALRYARGAPWTLTRSYPSGSMHSHPLPFCFFFKREGQPERLPDLAGTAFLKFDQKNDPGPGPKAPKEKLKVTLWSRGKTLALEENEKK